MKYRKYGIKGRLSGLFVLVVGLVLIGFSCNNDVASLNVNTDAIVNAVSSINTNSVQQRVTKEMAVAEAKTIFLAQDNDGVDFSNGPCLSDNLLPDWVADVAHNPRQAVDDQPENQCRAFRDGTARHFVELDSDGKLIRAE